MRFHHCVVLCGRSLFGEVIHWFSKDAVLYSFLSSVAHQREKEKIKRKEDETEWKRRGGEAYKRYIDEGVEVKEDGTRPAERLRLHLQIYDA